MVRINPVFYAAWIAVTIVAITTARGHGQDADQAPAEMTPEMQAEMEAWMKLAEPGEHHRHLEPYAGTWKGEVKMWMAPDTEPMVDESVSEARRILGGRYLEWKHTGVFQGSPFEGRALDGFNNGDQRYESIWVDNFGTLIVFFTGSCSEDGKKRVMTSQFTDPMTGGTIDYKTVYTWIDDDHFLYEALMDKGEGEFKNLEIRYERQ